MTILAEVKVVSADKCWCEFKDKPLAHDRLLGVEGMGVPYAVALVADIISNLDPGTGNEGDLFSEPDEIARFVAQHNWIDPVGMAALAEAVRYAADQAWSWRQAEKDDGRSVPR